MSQHSTIRHLRWSLLAIPVAGVLVLAGCSGSTARRRQFRRSGHHRILDHGRAGQRRRRLLRADGDEVHRRDRRPDRSHPLPLRRLQHAGDDSAPGGQRGRHDDPRPGTGQPISVITLADAGFLEPLDETSAGLLPAGSEAQFQIDGKTYAQPTALTPVGMVFNVTAADEVGINEYPTTYEDLLAACTDARDAGKSFTVLAGGIPFNTGLFSQLISATRVYAGDPRLERAARGRRCHLRRQRAGRRSSTTSSR